MLKRTLHFGAPYHLSTRYNQLVIRAKDETKAEKTVAIEDIGFIILEHPQITFTQSVITALERNKAAVIFCDEKHMPSSYIQPLAGHTEQTQRIRNQLGMSEPLKKNLWQQTVAAKILNQARHLEYQKIDAYKLLYWAKQVKSGDSENHEAMAAAYYWQLLFEDVEDFKRRRDEVPPNNLLNYGYAILRAVTARALVSTGFFPSVGIHHRNKYNAFCLADDIMEPYRIYVDELVREVVDEVFYYEELTKELKSFLLEIPNIDVEIKGKKRPLAIAMSFTTASLYDCIIGKRKKIKYPEYGKK